MHQRQADEGNWQARGQEFQVGQSVQLVHGSATDVGRVVATYPGIGMVQVQWPHTSYRHPVEDLQIINPGDDPFITPMHEDVPGGPGSAAQLSEGAPQSNIIEGEIPRVELVHEVKSLNQKVGFDRTKMISRVARAFVNKNLYEHAQFFAQVKSQAGEQFCPKGCGEQLRRASYQMRDGTSAKLHACSKCLFVIKSSDLERSLGGNL